MAFDSSEVAWKDLKVYLNGQQIVKFTGLKYKTTREVEELRGQGDDVYDLQAGNKAHEGTFTAYKSAIDKMNQAAVAAGFDDLTDVPWVIVADYKATSTDPRQTDTLPNVRFTEYEKGMEQNAKSMPIALPFKSKKPIAKYG